MDLLKEFEDVFSREFTIFTTWPPTLRTCRTTEDDVPIKQEGRAQPTSAIFNQEKILHQVKVIQDYHLSNHWNMLTYVVPSADVV